MRAITVGASSWYLHPGDRLPIPPFPSFGARNPEPQSVAPIAEIDSRPGFYAGVEWTYAQRLTLKLASYENRARIDAIEDGQWGWHMRFSHLGLQASLSARLGLIVQWMHGDTTWIAGARPDEFSIVRPGSETSPVPEDGHAKTLAYRYSGLGRVALAAEWLEIASARDLWSVWYAEPRERTERQILVRVSYELKL